MWLSLYSNGQHWKNADKIKEKLSKKLINNFIVSLSNRPQNKATKGIRYVTDDAKIAEVFLIKPLNITKANEVHTVAKIHT